MVSATVPPKVTSVVLFWAGRFLPPPLERRMPAPPPALPLAPADEDMAGERCCQCESEAGLVVAREPSARDVLFSYLVAPGAVRPMLETDDERRHQPSLAGSTPNRVAVLAAAVNVVKTGRFRIQAVHIYIY